MTQVAATAFSILGTKMFLKNRVSTKGATLAGFGIAIGMSYQNCEREMQLALTTPCDKGKKKKGKGEDDCLDLEEGNKKAENMSSDSDNGKQPDELKNDKKKKPVDLKNDKAKKAEGEKKPKAEDSEDGKAKKGAEPKKDKNKKVDGDKIQKPSVTKDNKSDDTKIGKQ